MGYLNNTTVTVDAILTKKGRELLAKGAAQFNITQFALADDEIDYDLWNSSHPLGDDKMGVVIENLPITEAVPDETQSMKYKLITLSEGTKAIPYIEATPTALTLLASAKPETLNENSVANLLLQLKKWSDQGAIDEPTPGSYTFTMLDTTYFTVLAVFDGKSKQRILPTALPPAGKSQTWNLPTTTDVQSLQLVVAPAAGWGSDYAALNGKSTKIIFTNTRYGSRYVVPISYTNDNA